MLEFYPAYVPWTFPAYQMTQSVPAGIFYLHAEYNMPRSTKPSRFLLATDRSDPVNIEINDVDMGTIIPTKDEQSVFLDLFEPPAINFITVSNGVDEPVHLQVVVTYMASVFELIAREEYEVAGRINEKYFNLLTSPWNAFILEYQLPWQSTSLPDIRSLRIMSVRMLGNTLFNSSGTQGGVTDFVSAFTATTPVWKGAKNPQLWQPDLYQPVTSADDAYGYEAHIWVPNLCLAKWHAFMRVINNVDNAYALVHGFEDKAVVQAVNADLYEQHLFDNLSPNCTVTALLDYLGCLDNIVVAGRVDLTCEVAICAFATPFDQVVEHPGIGAYQHFDSGTDFDGDYGPFDTIYDVDLLTDYWLGTTTKKSFDFGKCLDGYPTTASQRAEDVNCCMEGPDTVIFTTMGLEDTVTSTVTPNHPIFGGDTPGLLDNPYFDKLA